MAAAALGEGTYAQAAAACAVEFIHCASLVHDDLPMFDNAATRRGRPSLHRVYGEPIALLVGDGLLMGAFEVLGAAALASGCQGTALLPPMVQELARAAGAGCGLVSGQAWESEPNVHVAAYHRAKTASLFEGACVLGAVASGAGCNAAEAWRKVGLYVGQAYQVADDLADHGGANANLGKPTGVDAARQRPNMVTELGVGAAKGHLERLLHKAVLAVPTEAHRQSFEQFIHAVGRRLLANDSARLSNSQHSGYAAGQKAAVG